MARSGKSDSRVDNLSYDIRDGINESVKKTLTEVGVDAQDSYKRTSLIWAAFYNNTELIKWLIENGADVNHQDSDGFSALHFAVKEQSFDATEILINSKAELEIKDNNGNTPLMDAIYNSNGNYKSVAFFIDSGANLDNANNHEMTPRLLAESISGFDYKLSEVK